MFGKRIKQAREAMGYNQRSLAAIVNLSAMAISKYERDESIPSSKVLLSLAKALNVRTEYFFRQVEVELEDVEYREYEEIPKLEEAKVLADIKDQVERWAELEKFLPVPWSKEFLLPEGLPDSINSIDEIENVAVTVRHAWDLGLNPITDFVDMLECKGIKVFITQYDGHEHFNGLTATVHGAPVVVVGKHWPGDRQRFTLAHELGHLILKGRLSAEIQEENACNRFAGAFLVPKPMVTKILGEKRKWLEPHELMLLKEDWGLSMGGWLHRADELGIVVKTTIKKLWSLFKKRGWKTREPDPQYPAEETNLFEQLTYHALAEDIVSESKAAELLTMSVMELHACRNMECLDDTTN